MANRRHVVPSGDKWANKAAGAKRATSLHDTQADAIGAARRSLTNEGGGELTIHRRDGRIRDSDTVAPGNDPNPPKDRR
jgi:hypothetical protein